MMMRKHKVEGAYEKLKELTRGASIDEAKMRRFIEELEIEAQGKISSRFLYFDLFFKDKEILTQLRPSNYTGLAQELAEMLEEFER